MGVVYLAEQREPIQRRVALKVIKVGMDSKEVMARFQAERQALAIISHPGIAKVIDFGVAKATAQRLAERTGFTELGRVEEARTLQSTAAPPLREALRPGAGLLLRIEATAMLLGQGSHARFQASPRRRRPAV